MNSSNTWLSLNDLGNLYGISALHCGRTLQQKGWSDKMGYPTPAALKMGIANSHETKNSANKAFWNAEICKNLLEKTGYQPISREVRIKQWVSLLSALAKGSPSVNATAEQMSEDLPKEFINAVNSQLAKEGCQFRVQTNKNECKYTFSN